MTHHNHWYYTVLLIAVTIGASVLITSLADRDSRHRPQDRPRVIEQPLPTRPRPEPIPVPHDKDHEHGHDGSGE